MRFLLSLLVCVGLALDAGCSVESTETGGRRSPGDGAAGAAGEPSPPSTDDARSMLIIEGEAVVQLGFSESVELAVTLQNSEGEPERDRQVAFDLIGRPEDSSLSALVARTNSSGRARVTLHAASRPVTFEVRASNGRAPSVSFSVSVSSSGFGSLIVNAPYSGVRSVEQRFVFARPEVSCAAAVYSPGDPKTVLAPEEDRATLIALPAGLPYAVVAIGQSASGATVARGCVAMMVAEQGEDEITVPFLDLPLLPEKDVSVEVTLEADSAAAAIGAAIRSAVSEVVRTSGESAPRDAEGHFWLDSLETSLRDADDIELQELADALSEARLDPEGGSPENELAGLLALNEEGADAAARAIAARVRDALDTLVLSAGLALEATKPPTVDVTVDSLRIEALPVIEGDAAPSVVLSAETASAAAELMSDQDMLAIHELDFAPQLGALGAEALAHVVAADAADLGEDLVATAGCASLSEWLGKQAYVPASMCQDACIARACAAAFSRITSAASDALEQIDDVRPTATLGGSFALTDDDGDLRAERMIAERIDGSWAPAPEASLGDTLRGTASAVPAP